MGSRSHRDLVIWQKGIELSVLVYHACSNFPRTELYALADQMKRAAVPISSNIAQGQARHYIGELPQFLSISNGSPAELDTQRIIAGKMSFLSPQRSVERDLRITEIWKMLYSLRSKLKTKN